MLDNGDRRRVEFRDQFEGSIRIVDIIIGEFLALKLNGGGGAGWRARPVRRLRPLLCRFHAGKKNPLRRAGGEYAK